MPTLAMTAPSPAIAAIQAFSAPFSIEVPALDVEGLVNTATWLPAGTEVFVPALPDQADAVLVQACTKFRKGGYEPVPHIAARLYTRLQLEDVLDALATHSGVDRALVVGGDIEHPLRGHLGGSAEALGTGLLAKYGFKTIGIAGYPDGHRWISSATLRASLEDKLRVCQLEGHEPFIAMQFSFDAERIVRWCEEFIAAHPGIPIAVGMAGPARLGTLLRYATRCGVSGTLRALTTYRDTTARLLRAATPDRELSAVARLANEQPGVLRPHFFTFGGFAQTLAWLHAIEEGRIRVHQARDGFAVV